MTERTSRAARVLWSLVALLIVLRCDFWWWEDDTLLFDFLPLGLAWQALISIAAAVVWFAMVRLAWPEWIEAWADTYAGDAVEEEHR